MTYLIYSLIYLNVLAKKQHMINGREEELPSADYEYLQPHK